MLSSINILSQHANTVRAPHMYFGSHAQEHSMFDNADRIVQLRRSRLVGNTFLKRAIQNVVAAIGHKRYAARS